TFQEVPQLKSGSEIQQQSIQSLQNAPPQLFRTGSNNYLRSESQIQPEIAWTTQAMPNVDSLLQQEQRRMAVSVRLRTNTPAPRLNEVCYI
ncbi:hypothetical protein L9F63_018611, partial [Diploptera punctata]